MEKKAINKKFYIYSSFNILPALVLGGGFTKDSLFLIFALIALVLNHVALVKTIVQLTTTMTTSADSSKRALKKFVFFMAAKFLTLGALVGVFYYYDKALLPKVILMMIFQLIIQVISIKNNHLKS